MGIQLVTMNDGPATASVTEVRTWVMQLVTMNDGRIQLCTQF